MKYCPCCKLEKQPGAFYRNKSKPGGLSSYCKLCHPRKRDPEKQKRSRLKWGAKNPKRAAHLRNRYGLTIEGFDKLLRDQAGGCAICGRPHVEQSPLYVDHCHTTGKVRGLLCPPCNTTLGQFHEDTGRFRKAIEYLETHNGVQGEEQPE